MTYSDQTIMSADWVVIPYLTQPLPRLLCSRLEDLADELYGPGLPVSDLYAPSRTSLPDLDRWVNEGGSRDGLYAAQRLNFNRRTRGACEITSPTSPISNRDSHENL